MAALSREVDRHAPRIARLEALVRGRTPLRELECQLERLPPGAEKQLLSLYASERRKAAKGRGWRVMGRIATSLLLLAACMVAWLFWRMAADA